MTGSSASIHIAARVATRQNQRMDRPASTPSRMHVWTGAETRTAAHAAAHAATYSGAPGSSEPASAFWDSAARRASAARSARSSTRSRSSKRSATSTAVARVNDTWWLWSRDRTRFSKSSKTPWSVVTPATTTQPRRLCIASSRTYKSVCRGCKAKASSSESTTNNGARRSARRRRSSSTSSPRSSTYRLFSETSPEASSCAASSRKPAAASACTRPLSSATS
mmetsp:Transcript_9921/g.30058  ORF Transcript_9921/g.30058 Transcript_9921/m.30058 type:complete len:223 (+) Transcript_9921:479-1147(+)